MPQALFFFVFFYIFIFLNPAHSIFLAAPTSRGRNLTISSVSVSSDRSSARSCRVGCVRRARVRARAPQMLLFARSLAIAPKSGTSGVLGPHAQTHGTGLPTPRCCLLLLLLLAATRAILPSSISLAIHCARIPPKSQSTARCVLHTTWSTDLRLPQRRRNQRKEVAP